MPYIYAIIREKETGKLQYLQENYNDNEDVEDSLLCKCFNYAYSLSSAYCSYLEQITIEDFKLLNDYDIRKKSRKNAYFMLQALDEIKANNDVVAFSHRYGGFTHIDWNFNDDITFHIYTNFGYGSASDFNATFMYKDVLLAPYSYYVKYRYSDYASVVRCTYQYNLNFEEWPHVMRDCLDFYNAVVSGNESYVFKWIKEQIEYMVYGLKKFLSYSSFSFYEERFNIGTVSKMATITDDDFWIVKAGKISNSLQFTDNLKVLPMQVEAEKYSAELYKIAEDFVPMLSEKINTVKKEVAIEEDKLHALKDKGDYPLYFRIKKKYYDKKQWYYSTNKFSMMRFLMKLLSRLYPQYCISEARQRLKALDDLIKKVDESEKKLNSLNFLQYSLEKSHSTLLDNIAKYSKKQDAVSVEVTD